MGIKQHIWYNVIRYNKPGKDGRTSVHMDTIDGRVVLFEEESEAILRMLGWLYIDMYLEKCLENVDEMLGNG